jgi:hypothetical protein
MTRHASEYSSIIYWKGKIDLDKGSKPVPELPGKEGGFSDFFPRKILFERLKYYDQNGKRQNRSTRRHPGITGRTNL